MNDMLAITATSAVAGGAVGVGTWAGAPFLDLLNTRELNRLNPQVAAVGGNIELLPPLLRWWRAATVGIGLLFWLGFQMPPIALFLSFVVHKAGPLAVEVWTANRRKKITEQAATAARGLAAQVRVGVTLTEGLTAVAQDTPNPFGGLLRRATAQLEQGQDEREVLAELKRSVKVDAVALMSAALLVDELQRVSRKRDVDTAAGRFMVLIMSIFPAGFLIMLCVMDPNLGRTLSDTLGGQIVLAAVGMLVWLSVRWASRILAKVE
jgi:Flp pilus assembly protein TadB